MFVGDKSGISFAVAGRTGVLASAVALAFGLLASSAAIAQNCSPLTMTVPNIAPPPVPGGFLASIGTGLSGGLAISAALAASNTAFLTQSTVFASAPANPKPDSEGGGIWIRGVGGELTLNSNTQVNVSLNVPPVPPGFPTPAGTYPGSTTCSAQFRQTFGGFQLGQDIAKFNVAGWNVHLGTTAGFLETTGNIVGGNIIGGAFNSTTQAPFVGMYGVATFGGFFIDGVLRYDYFQTTFDSPTADVFNQKLSAHGFSAAASTGYNWQVPNSSWYIEPSAGVVWSREAVDPFNVVSPFFFGSSLSGTTRLDDIESIIGRIGVRVGTTLETNSIVYEPFAAVSVWHDFASNIAANYGSCPNCLSIGGVVQRGQPLVVVPVSLTANLSTNNIGTFGQYSLGVSGHIKNTGWLGFMRVDYREGPNMQGLSGTGGIRYRFTPAEIASVMPVKAKTPVQVDFPVSWTGWYVGAIGGAEYGRSSMVFPGVSSADMRPAGFLGGGTVGYNFQAGKWVYGLEGDISWTNANGSTQCAPLAADQVLFHTTCHDELNWIATATARLGYAWAPRTLLYVKAGGAWAEERFSLTCNLGPLNGAQFNPSCTTPASNPFPVDQASVGDIRVGWTVGIGTEFALTEHWSAKGEFDWLDFGSKSLVLSDGTAINTTQRIAQGKIGLNYKFAP
jgi:opacity protein-like surface antigen